MKLQHNAPEQNAAAAAHGSDTRSGRDASPTQSTRRRLLTALASGVGVAAATSMVPGSLGAAAAHASNGSAKSPTVAAPATAAGGARRMRPVLPARLEPGMTLGLLMPGSPVPEDEDIRAAVDRVRSLGFQAKTGPNVGRRDQYLAGSDAERAADLNSLIADPEVDALFCIRGGYGSARILPLIDYEAISARPKVILGYSDITAILNAVHVRTGLVTFHGPVAAANFTDYAWGEFRKVLMTPEAPVGIGAAPPFEGGPGVIDIDNRTTRIHGGRAEGRLVGGNLTLLAHLMGTPFEPDFAGAILFIEDVGESPYRIDRMLSHLWLAGRLQQVAGIVFGKFTQADADGNSFSVEHVLRDRCEPLGIPVLRGLMIGHVPDQTVVPIGIRAALDADAGTLTLLEPAVK